MLMFLFVLKKAGQRQRDSDFGILAFGRNICKANLTTFLLSIALIWTLSDKKEVETS